MAKQYAKMNLRITNTKEFQKLLGEVDTAVRDTAIDKALRAGAFVLESEIKLNIQKQKLVDKGALVNSIALAEVEIDGSSGEATVGTNLVYARIHEFGGTIKPINAKWLTIPTASAKGTRANAWPNLTFVPISGTLALLMDDDGDVKFVLRKVVTMPARPYMRPAVTSTEKKAAEPMLEAIKAEVGKVVKLDE